MDYPRVSDAEVPIAHIQVLRPIVCTKAACWKTSKDTVDVASAALKDCIICTLSQDEEKPQNEKKRERLLHMEQAV